MKRWDIINEIIGDNAYTDYLEIGVRPKGNISRIEVLNKTGVDPNKPTDYQMTSDEFFAQCKKSYDIIFIDGLHIYEQVLKDVRNALEHLNHGGTIVMHDCSPKTEKAQKVPRESKCWNGTVWKAWVVLRCSEPNLEMYVLDTDHGCGIIRRGKQEVYTGAPLEECLTWNYLNKHRKKLLNLREI